MRLLNYYRLEDREKMKTDNIIRCFVNWIEKSPNIF